MNVTGLHWWSVNIGSGNGLVLSLFIGTSFTVAVFTIFATSNVDSIVGIPHKIYSIQRNLIHIKSRSLCWMSPSAPRVCSQSGGQKPVLTLSLDSIAPAVLLSHGTVAGRDYLPEANPGNEPRSLARQRWHATATPLNYLSQCWPRSLSPYGVTRPQWVKIRGTFVMKYHLLWKLIQHIQKLSISIQKCHKEGQTILPPESKAGYEIG